MVLEHTTFNFLSRYAYRFVVFYAILYKRLGKVTTWLHVLHFVWKTSWIDCILFKYGYQVFCNFPRACPPSTLESPPATYSVLTRALEFFNGLVGYCMLSFFVASITWSIIGAFFSWNIKIGKVWKSLTLLNFTSNIYLIIHVDNTSIFILSHTCSLDGYD